MLETFHCTDANAPEKGKCRFCQRPTQKIAIVPEDLIRSGTNEQQVIVDTIDRTGTEPLLGPAIHEFKPVTAIRTKGSFSPASGFALPMMKSLRARTVYKGLYNWSNEIIGKKHKHYP